MKNLITEEIQDRATELRKEEAYRLGKMEGYQAGIDEAVEAERERIKPHIAYIISHMSPIVYQAMTEGSQTSYWHCWGCKGEFVSRWPQWEEPTFENFPHEKHCRAVEALQTLTPTKTDKQTVDKP